MKYGLLTCIAILLLSSNVVHAGHLTNNTQYSYGGWLGASQPTDKYSLNEYVNAGVYGSIVYDNIHASGMAYYDPVYESVNLGYLYTSYSTQISNHNVSFDLGLVRSRNGFWTDDMINPSTAPLLLLGDSIYHKEFANNMLQGVGLATTVTRRDVKFTLFVGGNFTANEEDYIASSYIQDVDFNNSFGSNIEGVLEIPLSRGHIIKGSAYIGNLAKEIDLDTVRYQVGYKYSLDSWIFTAEYRHLEYDGNIEYNNPQIQDFHKTVRLNDIFVYLGYDFPKYRIYGVYSYSERPPELIEFFVGSTLKNTLENRSGILSKPDIIGASLLAEDRHVSNSLSVGINYMLTPEINLRAEGTYVHAVGAKRVFNSRDGEIWDTDTVYAGVGITYTF